MNLILPNSVSIVISILHIEVLIVEDAIIVFKTLIITVNGLEHVLEEEIMPIFSCLSFL